MANKPIAVMWSKSSKETMVSYLENQIRLFSQPDTKDGGKCWGCYVDGKLAALEQTLEFVEGLNLI